MGMFGSAALLAGGRSRRMGFDKQLLHVSSNRLFERIIPVLKDRFDEVMVVTGHPDIYRGTGVKAISDIIPGLGPLSGIHTAVSEAKSDYIYILACDMPRIDLPYIDYMTGWLEDNPADACVTRIGDWIEPFHAFYGKGAVATIEADLHAGNSTVYTTLQKTNTFYIPEPEARRFTPDWSLFRNLNTIEEYEEYLKTARE
jgi:molybdopterin-guanine dinucleotide biosynthesis protein A